MSSNTGDIARGLRKVGEAVSAVVSAEVTADAKAAREAEGIEGYE